MRLRKVSSKGFSSIAMQSNEKILEKMADQLVDACEQESCARPDNVVQMSD